MANVGSGDAGKTLIGAGNGKSPTYASIGTNSGLTAHGVVVAENLGAFTALNPGLVGQVLVSNGFGSDPSFQTISATGAITTITGNSGGAESASAGNFNILGTGSITVAGTAATETVQLTGLTNHSMLVGAGTATITKVAPSATAGIPLVSNGSSADPSFTTAVVAGGGTGQTTFPAHSILIGAVTSPIGSLSPGATGTLVRSTGASSDPGYTTASYPTTSGSSGNLITSNGTDFVSVAPQASSLITTFTSSGTWTKDSRTQFIRVIAFNSGGSGASGRKGATTASGGGGGGGGGSGFSCYGPASIFGNSETVTIGALTAGALAQSLDLNNGINGAAPNATSMGNLGPMTNGLVASTGGTTTNGSGGSGGLTINTGGSGASSGSGGAGRNLAGTSPTTYNTANGVNFTGGGGGGGGGYDTVTERTGGIGCGWFKFDGSTTLLAGGTAGLESVTINGGPGNIPLTSGGIITGGSGGGGGGGPSVGTTPGTGGDGAEPGGAGGGGGGGISAVADSGVGGSGAKGRLIVIEYF